MMVFIDSTELTNDPYAVRRKCERLAECEELVAADRTDEIKANVLQSREDQEQMQDILNKLSQATQLGKNAVADWSVLCETLPKDLGKVWQLKMGVTCRLFMP